MIDMRLSNKEKPEWYICRLEIIYPTQILTISIPTTHTKCVEVNITYRDITLYFKEDIELANAREWMNRNYIDDRKHIYTLRPGT